MLTLPLATLSAIRSGEAAPGTPSIESAPTPLAAAPYRVSVGVLLLAIGDANITTETYEMELYLIFHCDRPCNPGNFEIINGRAITQDLLDNTPTYQVFRIRALLRSDLDLRAYPFDRYPVSISIEDRLLPEENLVYVADPGRTAIDAGVHVLGWTLDGRGQGRVESHAYPVFRQTYSRYTFAVNVERPRLAGFFKVLLPALFLVGIGLLALLLSPDHVTQRLTVSTSALVATLLFHLGLRQVLPPISYLTLADRLMIVNYAVLTLSVATAVVLLHLTDTGRTKEANRLHLVFKTTVPALWILLLLVNMFTLRVQGVL
jgi:hypothetical protein